MTICARTGWWKTTLGLNIALNMIHEHKVGFISLEMTEEEIGDKIVSRIGRVRHSALTINKFKDREIEWIKMRANEIKFAIENLVRAYNCYTLEQVEMAINQMAERWCEIVFLDRLWMIEAPGNSQPERMRNVMATLKELATKNNRHATAQQTDGWRMKNATHVRHSRRISNRKNIITSTHNVERRWQLHQHNNIQSQKTQRR